MQLVSFVMDSPCEWHKTEYNCAELGLGPIESLSCVKSFGVKNVYLS